MTSKAARYFQNDVGDKGIAPDVGREKTFADSILLQDDIHNISDTIHERTIAQFEGLSTRRDRLLRRTIFSNLFESETPYIETILYEGVGMRRHIVTDTRGIVLLRVPSPMTRPVFDVIDPAEQFKPSGVLARRLMDSMVPLDEKTQSELKETSKKYPDFFEGEEDPVNMLAEEIDGLFANLVSGILQAEQVLISDGPRFSRDISFEIIELLDLDIEKCGAPLQKLYAELFSFVSVSPRERGWGKIVVEDSNLILIPSEHAVKFPEI